MSSTKSGSSRKQKTTKQNQSKRKKKKKKKTVPAFSVGCSGNSCFSTALAISYAGTAPTKTGITIDCTVSLVHVENCFLGADGVGQGIEQRLWEQGITHWEAFEPTCDGIGETRRANIESFIEDGTRALERDDTAFFGRRFPDSCAWRLYETFREQACFFDIETTGLDHHNSVVTTVTFHQDGQTETLVRGDDLTNENLVAAFEDAGLVVTFNGARFDIPFLEATFDLSLSEPHLDLMPTARKVGLSGGLSDIEHELGISRDLPDVDGREAVRLWHEHERGVDGALDRLIEYNREDTVNMVPVAETLVKRLDEHVFPDTLTV
jgi:uncharacterized protein YprB with RNaseH-like and TPR domain